MFYICETLRIKTPGMFDSVPAVDSIQSWIAFSLEFTHRDALASARDRRVRAWLQNRIEEENTAGFCSNNIHYVCGRELNRNQSKIRNHAGTGLWGIGNGFKCDVLLGRTLPCSPIPCGSVVRREHTAITLGSENVTFRFQVNSMRKWFDSESTLNQTHRIF